MNFYLDSYLLKKDVHVYKYLSCNNSLHQLVEYLRNAVEHGNVLKHLYFTIIFERLSGLLGQFQFPRICLKVHWSKMNVFKGRSIEVCTYFITHYYNF